MIGMIGLIGLKRTFFILILSEFMVLAGLGRTNHLFAEDPSWEVKKFQIGESYLKEKILGYTFGHGARKILVLGGIHGDETSAIYLSWALQHYYSVQKSRIPANITLYIIPVFDLDGYYLHTRLNARGVDLNRNFPTANWEAGIHVLKAFLPKGGGQVAQSESETKALVNFIQKEKPYLTIAYHSRGGFISPELNDKIGIQLAKVFEKGSGIKSLVIDWSKDNYKVTGSLAQWLSMSLGLHVFILENKDKYAISDGEIKKNINGVNSIMKYISVLKELK
jgi:hypothetical protein